MATDTHTSIRYTRSAQADIHNLHVDGICNAHCPCLGTDHRSQHKRPDAFPGNAGASGSRSTRVRQQLFALHVGHGRMCHRTQQPFWGLHMTLDITACFAPVGGGGSPLIWTVFPWQPFITSLASGTCQHLRGSDLKGLAANRIIPMCLASPDFLGIASSVRGAAALDGTHLEHPWAMDTMKCSFMPFSTPTPRVSFDNRALPDKIVSAPSR